MVVNGDVFECIIVDQVDEDGNVLVDEVIGELLLGVEDIDYFDMFNGCKIVEEDYNDFLLSLNLNLGIIEDELVLYMGIVKVMLCFKIIDLNVNVSCIIYCILCNELDDLCDYCIVGNFVLQLYCVNQFDVVLNWYLDENFIIFGVYFIKDIISWVINVEICFDIDFFNDGCNFDVCQKINGLGVIIKGIEL